MFGFKHISGQAAASAMMSREIEKAALRVATGNLNENDKYVMRCKDEIDTRFTPKWR